MGIKLFVGLGNPGSRYDDTRHNAGFWFVDEIARQHNGQFHHEAKFHGDVCRVLVGSHTLWLLKPTTFMNKSGQAIRALADYYSIAVDEILVVHDELDIPEGAARLKKGGGHGGHNGLRDTIAHLGSNEFLRLRLGIDHPGHRDAVVNYVLGAPSKPGRDNINQSIDSAIRVTDLLVRGEIDKAIHQLHSR